MKSLKQPLLFDEASDEASESVLLNNTAPLLYAPPPLRRQTAEPEDELTISRNMPRVYSPSGSSQPGSSQPGSSQPGSSQPGSSQPGSSPSGSSPSGSSQPGSWPSGSSPSGSSQPGSWPSGSSSSGSSPSGSSQPGSSPSGAEEIEMGDYTYPSRTPSDSLIPAPSDSSSPAFAETKDENENLCWTFSKATLKLTAALVFSIANGLNSATAATGDQPSDVSTEWFGHLSSEQKIYVLWNLFASLLVNLIFAYDYIPIAIEKFKTSICKKNQTVVEILLNLLTITLGISAAIAAAAISYSALAMTSPWICGSVTTANFFINFATRYVANKTLINRSRGFFNEDMTLNSKGIYILNHISDKHLITINDIAKGILEKYKNQVNDEASVELFKSIDDINIKNHNIIKEKSKNEIFAKKFSAIFTPVIGIAAATAVAFTFMEKGFLGVNLGCTFVANLFGKNLEHGAYVFDGSSDSAKVGIGLLPSLSSSCLYAISAMDFLPVMISIGQDWWKNPRALPAACFAALSVVVGYSGTGMYNIAAGVMRNPAHFCTFLSDLNPEYPITNGIFGAVTNGTSVFRKTYADLETHDPKTIFIRYLKKKDVETNFTPSSRTALRSLALFRPESLAPFLPNEDISMQELSATRHP